MRSLRRCASNEFQAVAPRSGDFSSDIMSPSKKSLRATEQERADVARARRRWIRKQGLLDPARLVLIDETATSTSLVRLRGRCPRGERLVGSVPHGHWKTITLVVGLRHDGMVAPFVIDGNGTIFLAYVEQCLAPTLDRRDVVIMDNLPAHKVASVTDAIEAVGATAFYCHRIHLISTRSSRSSASGHRRALLMRSIVGSSLPSINSATWT